MNRSAAERATPARRAKRSTDSTIALGAAPGVVGPAPGRRGGACALVARAEAGLGAIADLVGALGRGVGLIGKLVDRAAIAMGSIADLVGAAPGR